MTSARKQFANRVNARRSTGPKTVTGKARAARNALRHGFAREGWAQGVLRDAAATQEIKALTHIIAGDGANEAQLDRASLVAAAQHDLKLLRQARRALQEAGGDALPSGDHVPIDADLSLLARIARLERYERRALTRRRRAVAAFHAVLTPVAPGYVAERSQQVKSQ